MKTREVCSKQRTSCFHFSTKSERQGSGNAFRQINLNTKNVFHGSTTTRVRTSKTRQVEKESSLIHENEIIYVINNFSVQIVNYFYVIGVLSKFYVRDWTELEREER